LVVWPGQLDVRVSLFVIARTSRPFGTDVAISLLVVILMPIRRYDIVVILNVAKDLGVAL